MVLSSKIQGLNFGAPLLGLPKSIYWGDLASATGTATTTPQIKDVIGPMRNNMRAARVART